MLLGLVDAGQDPADSVANERKAMTVRQLCEAYLAATDKQLILGKEGGLPKKASTLATDRGRIERHILPLLSDRKVRDLTTPDIARFMRDVSAGKTAADVKTGKWGRAIVEGGKGTAARTVGLLGGVLSFAISEGIIPVNPARGVKRPADQRRNVRLSAEQYRALGMAIIRAERAGRGSWHATALMRLLALTGCRRGEIETLRWADVDFAGQCLRLSDSKTGASVRALGSAALEILKALPRGGSEFVFPAIRATRMATAISGLPKAWKRALRTSEPDGVARQSGWKAANDQECILTVAAD